MITEEKAIINAKHYVVYNTINTIKNKKFYNNMDELLIKKRFYNAHELTLNENIFNIDSTLITEKDVQKIVSDFLLVSNNINFLNKKNIYEILEISYLPAQKLHKLFLSDKFIKLKNVFDIVSRETKLLSYDFIILKTTDNFIKKLSFNNNSQKKDFEKIRDFIAKKLINFNYEFEKKERETNFLCWIDRVLIGTINKEFTPVDFQIICNKIINKTNHSVYLYWKILNSVNYILLQRDFSGHTKLRTFKSDLEKAIEKKYTLMDLSQDELIDLTISVLSKDYPSKEDFYYLFDSIAVLASKSNKDKMFCIDLCEYIIYYDTKYNIFSYRFVRKHFLNTVFKIIRMYDNIEIKNEELSLLIKLFHVDHFFSFYRKDVFQLIIDILKNINNSDEKLTHNNFYKYCDIVDYLTYSNSDLCDIDIINYISFNKENSKKIAKRFQLLKLKN